MRLTREFGSMTPRTATALLALATLLTLAACQGSQQDSGQPAGQPTQETPAAESSANAAEPATPPATSSAPSGTTTAPGGTKPASKPRPAAPPPPETMTVRLPAGTVIDVELIDALSSGTNLPGDPFASRVVNDVLLDGRVVIPAGTTISGHVDEVVSGKNKKVGGRAKMVLAFETVSLETGDVGLTAWLTEKGKSETPKDAATIGGAAVVGAIIGHQIRDDDTGTAIGAIVGGAAGTAIAVNTKGKEVELPAGTIGSLELGAPLEFEILK